MTARPRVKYVVVCEDQQHETFARRFLDAMGLLTDQSRLRVERNPTGRGAADRFVRETYVTELDAGRRTHVATTLLVLIDGDNVGVERRLRELDRACRQEGLAVRSREDSVAIFIPTWNIETWLAYLEGEEVDEDVGDYPRLRRPSECGAHVRKLAEMCRHRSLRDPAPASLVAACEEFDLRLR